MQDYLDTGNVTAIMSMTSSHLHDVDFGAKPRARRQQQQQRYTIVLGDKLLRPGVTCVFPNARSRRNQIIASERYWTLRGFTDAINDAFEASWKQDGAVRLTVCYNGHAYVCNHLYMGTVYVVWATHIMHTNASHVANTLGRNIPVVVVKDGKWITKSVFILGDPECCECLAIDADSPIFSMDFEDTPFVREACPPPRPAVTAELMHRTVRTVTYETAMAMVHAHTQDGVHAHHQARNPLQHTTVDLEEEVPSSGTSVALELEEEMPANQAPVPERDPFSSSDSGE